MLWVLIAALVLYMVLYVVMVARLWRKYPADPFLKKLVWSVIIALPVFGMIFYGAWYKPLRPSQVKAADRWDLWIAGS